MMGTELCSSRMFSPFREESGDEELSLLPRHTKVVVTGNNRTKSVLVGLQGVVKKAVGLGGWHWLVLKNGVEVKLQRNALSVLEPPTGNEEDDDYDFDDSSSGSEIGEKFSFRFSCNGPYSKLCKPRVRYTKPWVTPASTKSMNCSNFIGIQSNNRVSNMKVNLSRLGTRSLLRYCQNFNLESSNSELTNDQLVHAVQEHFSAQQLDEVEVVVEFVRAAKRIKSSTQ